MSGYGEARPIGRMVPRTKNTTSAHLPGRVRASHQRRAPNKEPDA